MMRYLFIKSISFPLNRLHAVNRFFREDRIMKRTNTVAKFQQQNTEKNEDDEKTTKNQSAPKVVLDERPKLNLRSLRSQNKEATNNVPRVTASLKKFKSNQEESHVKVDNDKKELKPNTSLGKGKRRAVVDLQLMKEELKQLEDPPITPWEKEASSRRLQYEFFDVSCEDLAQQLLGKVLVRYLDDGTILKGRIVETEGYLGAIDKASQTYQNRITPRNLPMYMPPGTVYVYMTYGMYHCFNISSKEGNAYVLIKAVEPLMGFENVELLRNMRRTDNGREKPIAGDVTRTRTLKQHELCNNPFKICQAFVINQDNFDQKLVYACYNLWLENQPFVRSPTIVAVPPKDGQSHDSRSIIRDGCAVLVRAVDPLEGTEYMTVHRNTSKRKTALKSHELCNGPSKLCMAYQLTRQHSRYSLCTWKSLWIEDDGASEDFKTVKAARIGIESSGPEWSKKPLRYYIYDNKSVSKRDKKAETEIIS